MNRDITPAQPSEEKFLSPFVWRTTAELYAMEIPDTSWLIEGVIPKELVSVVVGASGAGKTWVCLSLLRAWATGEAWMGKYRALRCRAGFLDAEDGWRGVKVRWMQLDAGMGKLADDAELPLWISEIGAFDIIEPDYQNALAQAMRGLDVVIIDSLAQAHAYDENSADMRIIMQTFEKLARDTGCAVVLCHHSGHDKTRGRGSSTIKDRAQAQIVLSRDEGMPVTYLKLEKSKRGPSIPHLGAVRIEGTHNGPVSLHVVEADTDGAAHVDDAKVRARAYLTQTLRGIESAQTDVADDLAKALHCGRAKAYALIKVLVAEGVLTSQLRGRAHWLSLRDSG